ncbi:MAG: hypothetical protein ACM3X6_14100 [Patescibacteria group bacterium]
MHGELKHLLHWLFIAAAVWSLIAVAIPLPCLKRVWLPAFLTGFLASYPLNYLAVGSLGLWRFPPVPLTFLHTPFFLAVAWFGAMVVFDHLILVYSRFKYLFILGFSLLSTAIYAMAAIERHLRPGHWSYAEIFYLALIMHCVALYVLRLFRKDGALRPHENPLW